MQGPFSRDIFEGISRFCAQLESEDTFYKNPYHAYGQIQQIPVHGTLNHGGREEFLTQTSQSCVCVGGGG